MQKRLEKNIKNSCLEDKKAELEIICVVVNDNTTQIVVDYSGMSSNKSFIEKMRSNFETFEKCIKDSFELKNDYKIDIEISKKRWKLEKEHFVEKLISQHVHTNTRSS